MNTGNETDLSNYVANGEWDLVEARVERNVVFYSCCQVNLSQKQTLLMRQIHFQEPYPDVTYHFILRRRPLFYGKGTKRKFQALDLQGFDSKLSSCSGFLLGRFTNFNEWLESLLGWVCPSGYVCWNNNLIELFLEHLSS